MSEPNSASDPTPEAPKAPSFTYGQPAAAPVPPAAPLAPPQYGERLPAPVGAPAPGAAPGFAPAAGSAAPPARPLRTWDLVLTIILLILGLLGMGFGILMAVSIGDPAFLAAFEEALAQQGISGDIEFGAFGTIVAVSHVLLYVVALGVSILLLLRNKVAFWVPLTAGAIASLVFWGGYFVAIFSGVDLSSYTP